MRDFGALHERLVPGFVVDCRLDGDGGRLVTFFNGAVAREVLTWITNLLPAELSGRVGALMDRGIAVMTATLGAAGR